MIMKQPLSLLFTCVNIQNKYLAKEKGFGVNDQITTMVTTV